jgi:hypothetical protein
MRYRKLRIVWSVGWAIACVLLIVLWMRSYWWVVVCAVAVSSSRYAGLGSGIGELHVFAGDYTPGQFGERLNIQSYATANRREWQLSKAPPYHGALGFGILKRPGILLIVVPWWFVVFLAGMFAAVPRISCRFSLRTMLIATTLIAVVLGLIGYVTRH